jgi:hypothetical protein
MDSASTILYWLHLQFSFRRYLLLLTFSSKTMPAFQKLTASTYTLQILAKNKHLSSDIIKIITIKEKYLDLNAKLKIITLCEVSGSPKIKTA